MPSLKIESSNEAKEDIRLQTVWYDEQAGSDIAERYVTAFMSTAHSLSRQPDLGRLCHFRSRKLATSAASPWKAFKKHLMFYRLQDDTLFIFRVLHGVRDLPRRLVDPPGVE
jgi:toxin ParE1/3/4